MQVFSYIDTDYDLLADDHEAYADSPMRRAWKTREKAVKACIAEIAEFNDDIDDEEDQIEVPTPDDFEEEENGDLVYRESVDAPVYRVYAINIE